jgi:nucleoside-diphosphate-sugar epimerase
VFIISDGVGVPNEEFFGHYFRMLGGEGPRIVPRRAMTAMARAVDLSARAIRRENEVNANAVSYLSRRGTYSIEKARRVLGYEPRVGIDEGMRRTEAWLREAELL